VKHFQRTLVIGCSLIALAGCGADQIVSPGTSGDIIINNPAPAPAPTPTPPPTQSLVTPAAGCPTIGTPAGLTDAGTVTGPTGTYRVCRLPTTFTANDTLRYIPGLLYEIRDRVNVGVDQGFASTNTAVTVTIEPGVILFAQGSSFFVANRGNRLIANGTAQRPIIWTSRDNVLGLANDNSDGQWGGVVLLGRAPVSDCADLVFNTTANPTANAQCQSNLEGTAVTTPFGGTNSADNSGSFRFNQIRYSGFELEQGNELQSLTTGGTGSGTVIENLMSFNSSDDGIEFFGGSVNTRNMAIIGASDDSLDVDTGAQNFNDTVLVVQRPTTGDSLIELDSPNSPRTPIVAIPQTRMFVNNFTFVQRSRESTSVVRARGGAALSLSNGVIDAQNVCFRIDEEPTLAALIRIDAVVGNCGARPTQGSQGVTDQQVLDRVNAGTRNNIAFAITLTNTVVNGTGEAGVQAVDANPISTFFPTRTFIGAIENAAALTAIFGTWTCNSSTMNFSSPIGACTSLPVYS
jgi:hypothetical protein